MKNDSLNTQILLSLSQRKTGMGEKTLKAETVIGYDDATLTTEEFRDAIRFLEDKAMIEQFADLMGDTIWAITDMGLAYLKEKGL